MFGCNSTMANPAMKATEVKGIVRNIDYHILNDGRYCLCLVCMEPICNYADLLAKHLTSSHHQERYIHLFKLCFPQVVNASSELVYKSVLDISILLGIDASYICNRNGYYKCVICERDIVQAFGLTNSVVSMIFAHAGSKKHLAKVKRLSWIYHFGSNTTDYIKYDKSSVHCSICSETFPCKEDILLDCVVYHTQQHTLDIENVIDSDDTKTSLFPNNELGCYEPQTSIQAFNDSNIFTFTGNETVTRNPEYENRSQFELQTHVPNMAPINMTQNYDDFPSHSREQDDIKFEHLESESVLKDPHLNKLYNEHPVLRNNVENIGVINSNHFCKVCYKVVSRTGKNLTRELVNHFTGRKHNLILNGLSTNNKNTIKNVEKRKFKKLQMLANL